MITTQYNDEHVWVRIDDYDMAVVGISDHAQEQLGDIVYVELPDVGTEIDVGEEIVIIESVKTTSDILAPLSGTVIEVNEVIAERPEIINESPLDAGWLLRVEPSEESEIGNLMDEESYQGYVDAET